MLTEYKRSYYYVVHTHTRYKQIFMLMYNCVCVYAGDRVDLKLIVIHRKIL